MATDDDTLYNIGKAGEFPQRFAHMHDGARVELELDPRRSPVTTGPRRTAARCAAIPG